MLNSQLQAILTAHVKWLRGEAGGSRADLSDADLSDANLSDANLSRADLRGADLRGANLRGANLDFSCWPIWCGGLRIKIDAKIAAQLAYHFCAQECDDPEYRAARDAILGFANKFHRVKECGTLAPSTHGKEENHE